MLILNKKKKGGVEWERKDIPLLVVIAITKGCEKQGTFKKQQSQNN